MNGLAVDHLGNVYVSDRLRVRKVDNFGDITTVAG
ncbi:MAG: Teneurin-2, partial [Chitinophagia bacterium]|nr:Teneurin-2 [Chitinophagia bacterium]